MKRLFTLLSTAGVLGISLLVFAPSAMASDRINWSISIGAGVFPPPVVYAPPPVIYRQAAPSARIGRHYAGPPRHVRERDGRDGHGLARRQSHHDHRYQTHARYPYQHQQRGY